jgi:hypothetical protein
MMTKNQDNKTTEQLIGELEEKHNKEIKELLKEKDIRTAFLNAGITPKCVIDPLRKRPTVTINIDNLKDIKNILEQFKPVKTYFIDNTITTDLTKWENMKYHKTDGTVLNGLEMYKENNKFWLLDYPITLNIDHSISTQSDTTIRYFSDAYEIWIEFKTELLNSDELETVEEIDHYQTEQARRYNYKAKNIMMPCFRLKNTFNSQIKESGIVRIDFYRGHKKHFSIDEKGTKRIKTLLELI